MHFYLNSLWNSAKLKLLNFNLSIQSFVHCSTCYVNVDKEGDIEEKQYPVVCDPHKLIEVKAFPGPTFLKKNIVSD